jgi:magnesium transporter
MLRLFKMQGSSLREDLVSDENTKVALANALWIDAREPSDDEREELNTFLRAELPESDDVEEIEFSARYFQDSAGVHVHSLFLAPGESGRHSTVTVAFILQDKRLITLREDDIADFRLLRMRARAGQVQISSPTELLVTMFEQKVENLADALEDIHRKLEDVSRMVLEDSEAELEDAIDQLAKLEDSNGKIRLCLMDTQRSISFIQKHLKGSVDLQETSREIKRDVDTLMSHTAFLFDKINFLMDSTQGFINIEQNQIIKIFSIAAMVFLPPTVVASMYGMNFSIIPFSDWTYGFELAFAMMVLSAVLPYWYFKRKGWL